MPHLDSLLPSRSSTSRLPRLLRWALFVILAIAFGLPAQAQETQFIASQNATLNVRTAKWWTFTVPSSRVFVLRFASSKQAQCVITTKANAAAFGNYQSNSYIRGFDRKFGTMAVTLPAGSYGLVVRSVLNESTAYSVELDTDLVVSGYTYASTSGKGAFNVPAGGWAIGTFTVQSGYRVFVDGCNSGLQSYVIPANQIANFKARRQFTNYPDYAGSSGAEPGLRELKLQPGSYALAFYNDTSLNQALTYNVDNYRPTNGGGGSGSGRIQLSGGWSASWTGAKGNLKVGRIANASTTATTGSLHVELWALPRAFDGSAQTGYRMTSFALKAMKPNSYYANLNKNLAFALPPTGTWAMCLMVTEYQGASGYRIVAWSNGSAVTTRSITRSTSKPQTLPQVVPLKTTASRVDVSGKGRESSAANPAPEPTPAPQSVPAREATPTPTPTPGSAPTLTPVPTPTPEVTPTPVPTSNPSSPSANFS